MNALQTLFKKYRNIITIGLVVIAAFIAYSIFYTPDTGSPLTQTQVNSEQAALEQELLALLFELRSIELDTTIFDDARFRSLEDFGQEIISEPVGRDNPFAPIGQ